MLEALIPVHPIAAVILEHRHVAKLLDGFITSIKAHLDRVPRPPPTAGKVRGQGVSRARSHALCVGVYHARHMCSLLAGGGVRTSGLDGASHLQIMFLAPAHWNGRCRLGWSHSMRSAHDSGEPCGGWCSVFHNFAKVEGR